MLDWWLGITGWWWLSVAAALTASQMFDALTTWRALSFHRKRNGEPWREGNRWWAEIFNSNPRMAFVGAAVYSLVWFAFVTFATFYWFHVDALSLFGVGGQTIGSVAAGLIAVNSCFHGVRNILKVRREESVAGKG